MSALVENLLSLSRIELNQDQKPQDKVDPLEIVEDVAQSLEIKAKERKMTFHIIADKEIDPVRADAQQIRQIVQNLADNAIKSAKT